MGFNTTNIVLTIHFWIMLELKVSTACCHELQLLSFFYTVGMLGPRNLRVSDEWYTRFRVSWDPAPSRVTGYKLIYQPEGKISLLFYLDTFLT